MSLQPVKRARIDAHPLQALSIDLWRRIFDHLEWWDRAALSRTSHSLRRVRWTLWPPHVALGDVSKGLAQLWAALQMDQLEHTLVSLALGGSNHVSSPLDYAPFTRLTALTRLEFAAYRFPTAPLQQLPPFPHLRELCVRHMVMSPRLLAWASRSPLESLEFEYLSSNSDLAMFIPKLPLRRLTVLTWEVDHVWFIRHMSTLTALALSAPRGAAPLNTARVLEMTHKMAALRELSVAPIQGFLPPYSSLQSTLARLSLALPAPQFSDGPIFPCVATPLLSIFPTLIALSTPHIHIPSDRPTSSLLQSLTITGQRFRIGELIGLSLCSRLTHLALLTCACDPPPRYRVPGLLEVTSLKELRHYDLSGSSLYADNTIQDISALPNLENLDLSLTTHLLCPPLALLHLPSLTELHLPEMESKFYADTAALAPFTRLISLHVPLASIDTLPSVLPAIPHTVRALTVTYKDGVLEPSHLALLASLASVRVLSLRLAHRGKGPLAVDSHCRVSDWGGVSTRLAQLDLSALVCPKAAQPSLAELRAKMQVLMPGFL